jgi:hypothetical protein
VERVCYSFYHATKNPPKRASCYSAACICGWYCSIKAVSADTAKSFSFSVSASRTERIAISSAQAWREAAFATRLKTSRPDRRALSGSQGREAGRSSSHAVRQVRVRNQPQDHKGASATPPLRRIAGVKRNLPSFSLWASHPPICTPFPTHVSTSTASTKKPATSARDMVHDHGTRSSPVCLT